MDKYGRVLIPNEIRSKLNLKEGDSIEISVKGHELVLKKTDADLDKRVQAWVEMIKDTSPKPFVTEIRIGDSKWLSREYCLRKLGL